MLLCPGRTGQSSMTPLGLRQFVILQGRTIVLIRIGTGYKSNW